VTIRLATAAEQARIASVIACGCRHYDPGTCAQRLSAYEPCICTCHYREEPRGAAKPKEPTR
jgi:hypothetical protein